MTLQKWQIVNRIELESAEIDPNKYSQLKKVDRYSQQIFDKGAKAIKWKKKK